MTFAPGPDGGEVIAHPAATAHGFGGFGKRRVNAGLAVHRFGHRIAHRLHKTVDQCRLDAGACGGHDASGGNETGSQGVQKFFLPMLGVFFHGGQGTGDPGENGIGVAFLALGVFFSRTSSETGWVGKVCLAWGCVACFMVDGLMRLIM